MVAIRFIKNYFPSIVCGFFGSLGFRCLMYLMIILSFHEADKHPFGYPISRVVGLVSFGFCISMVSIIIANSINKKKVVRYYVHHLVVMFVSFCLSGFLVAVMPQMMGL